MNYELLVCFVLFILFALLYHLFIDDLSLQISFYLTIFMASADSLCSFVYRSTVNYEVISQYLSFNDMLSCALALFLICFFSLTILLPEHFLDKVKK
ncbi:hypothetical protein AT251_09850 [Enterovibrio nigricans]|uniref:Uncharacterized protein n=1 Tax=Enterovibrio nigricans DSM 22720 TaxID=1121868 RepID=A0A1T4UR11_9GAMM|nr:hypothetical protein AT251_09850 [Enterovibrio nigricans]SKA55139.1 hypothetical protein SAMN02745132_02280 [Enterovibrio nigricans DSM 22720]